MSDEPIQVYGAQNSIEATFIVEMLEEAGIQARIASNALEAISGEVPFQLISVPIWVRHADSQRALDVIREHQMRVEQK